MSLPGFSPVEFLTFIWDSVEAPAALASQLASQLTGFPCSWELLSHGVSATPLSTFLCNKQYSAVSFLCVWLIFPVTVLTRLCRHSNFKAIPGRLSKHAAFMISLLRNLWRSLLESSGDTYVHLVIDLTSLPVPHRTPFFWWRVCLISRRSNTL